MCFFSMYPDILSLNYICEYGDLENQNRELLTCKEKSSATRNKNILPK